MKLTTGSELGTAVLKALGIPSENVYSLSIDMSANDMATVTLTRVIMDNEAADILHQLEAYALERKPEDPAKTAMEIVARNLTRG